MAGWERDADYDVLERIVALLFALATLADRACTLSGHRRHYLLDILMWGETEARALVVGMASGPFAPGDVPQLAFSSEDAPAPYGDPAMLAASFRLLAFVLWFLLGHRHESTFCGSVGPQAGRHSLARRSKPAGPAALFGRCPLSVPDTS